MLCMSALMAVVSLVLGVNVVIYVDSHGCSFTCAGCKCDVCRLSCECGQCDHNLNIFNY